MSLKRILHVSTAILLMQGTAEAEPKPYFRANPTPVGVNGFDAENPGTVSVQTQSSRSVSGTPYVAQASSTTRTTGWALREAPTSWLAISPTGLVTGTPPQGTTAFSYITVATDAQNRTVASAPVAVHLDQPTLSVSFPSRLLPGDPVTGQASTNLPSATFGFSNLPDWLSSDATGHLSGIAGATPATTNAGAAASSGQAYASGGFTFVVDPVSVTLAGLPASVTSGKEVSGTVSASVGSGWSYDLTGAPGWLRIGTGTATASGTADSVAGTFQITPSATRNGVRVTGSSVQIKVVQPLAVATQPQAFSSDTGASGQTTATLSGGPDGAITWVLSATSGEAVPSWLKKAVGSCTGLSCVVGASPPAGTAATTYPGTGSYVLTGTDSSGATVTTTGFKVTVTEAIRSAATSRPDRLEYLANAYDIPSQPPAATTLSLLYDRNETAVAFTARAVRAADFITFAFDATTRTNGCRIALKTNYNTTNVTLAIKGSGTPNYTVNIPISGRAGVYEGTCGLPANTSTTSIQVSQLSGQANTSGFGGPETLDFTEFRMGYNGSYAP